MSISDDFTPKPWTPTSYSSVVGSPVMSADQLVANVVPRGRRETEANAFLIASAPDLLHAADYLLDVLDHELKHPNPGERHDPECKVCEASAPLRKAVLKARGGKKR